MDLADEISDEYLTCSICLDPYQEPKQLPCLHSFCRKCLGDHIANNVPRGRTLSFTCPVCRKVTKPANPDGSRLKEWADAFPDNFFILGLMETLNTRSSRSTVHNIQKTLNTASEKCTKHPVNKCDAYCTLKRVGVCGQCCLAEHRDCGNHHLNTDDAADVTALKLKDFKAKMETFKDDVERAREKFELSKPRELRLQKEELALKISEHFSDLKSKLVKCLIQKEKEVAEQLADIIEKEKNGISDKVDECSSLIKSFHDTVDLFDKLMSNSSINALTALYNIEEQIASYTTAVETLQSSSEKTPVEFVPLVNEVEEIMAGIRIGVVRLGAENVDIKIAEEAEEEVFGSAQEAEAEAEQEIPQEPAEERLQAAAPVVPSAPPPPEERPYCLQGFSSASLSPRPGENYSSSRHHPQRQNQHQQSSHYVFPSRPLSSSTSPSRYLQSQTTEDFDVTLWRSLSFFGNMTFVERRGGLVGITAMSRNLCAVSDRFNNCIKVINIKGRILNTLTFGNMDPWDITYAQSIRQLVVTCPNQAFIVFVADDTDNNSYYISETVQTRPYSSISSLRNNTYVVGVCRPHGNPRVDVINSFGTVLSYVDVQCQYPRSVQALSDGKLVICDWTKKAVVMVGTNGAVIKSYHGVESEVLKEPNAMTKDNNGNVYILDHKTRKIHILSGQTGDCRTVVPLEGCQDPRTIAMVESSRCGQALVIADSQNGIHVFSVEAPLSPTQV
ncbi:tripartite motif-containing protein 2-like [Haliotis asinina]|uniref:tripartite motif-containing protein 2-like n=1 Tax=Haliotis asinina TaxID=109174 RepID=UPI00353233B6